jgi:hypothetical protein
MVFAALSCAVVLFHLAVILGAPWGRLTMGGRWPGVLPGPARVLSGLSAALTVGMAVVLWRNDPVWAVWVVVGITVLSVIANAATPSQAERLVWLPVAIAMALSALSVAV